MACGVPVVAAAVGVNREIIRGRRQRLSRVDTETSGSTKLGRLLADPDAARAASRAAGRRTIEERYSLRVNAPTLAAMLRRGVGASRDRTA